MGRGVITVECYPGASCDEIARELGPLTGADTVIDTTALLIAEPERSRMLAPFLTDDRVFGYMAPYRMADVLDADRVAAARACIDAGDPGAGVVLIVGPGAAMVHPGDVLVYADMPRWEIQKRLRAGAPNWLIDNSDGNFLGKYKAGYFIEWRIADRFKMEVFDRVDWFLDSTTAKAPKAVDGAGMRAALAQTVTQPFRVMPFFDPGVWGGQWMRSKFNLQGDVPNYAWGFDCVPEENSLLIDFGGTLIEIPSINLVLRHPEALLGERVHARFGREFPIRFDLLDTMEGGNLSLQVHPDTSYARERFGIAYTQDESYYILDAAPDAHVYLGLKDGMRAGALFDALDRAQAGSESFEAERYVNRWPAAKHDHFSIPAGTIHCAGEGCVVLEISATPYIFTFKLWDWERTGLDGKPRPIHAEHGKAVLREDRDASWVKSTVLDQVEIVAQDDDVREERTGLHPLEFIETRRHWFTDAVEHSNDGSVHVLNLVEGRGALVESPDRAFSPFRVGYAETFIVPAAVGRYTIRPENPGRPHATIRAAVRI